MKVVVGLGNPGAKYDGTRHNVGYAVVDYLAAAPGASRPRARFEAEVVELAEGGASFLLVKPQTFMNLSGRSVRQVLDFYKVPVEDLLVVCDDISLPLGKLRARARGSHGGHNGLRNIQDHLGTQDYARLRIGVDAPRHDDAVDHVLGRFRPGERPVIEEAVAAAARAVLLWARDGVAACMNRVNGPSESEKPKKKKKPDPDAPPPDPNP
jgi:PTH1 family peptidyl-tRNA hydrolase